jgi:zinc transporter 1/2/3
MITDSKKPSWVENMTPFVLMIGLGVHATFEGLALGMSKDFDSTLLFAIAIVLHKGAAGMSLGISMGKTFPGQDSFVIKLLFLFAMFTPVGVALGWVLNSSSELTEIIFSCLAAGSFLYIACSEVIVEEFSISQHRFLKLFAFLIGISIITCLKFVEAGGDDDSSR